MLVECHQRIREFLQLAISLGEAKCVTDVEARDVARRIHTYFTRTFPVHVADEEDVLRPVLGGRSVDVDAALWTMHVEHSTYLGCIASFLSVCQKVIDVPTRRGALLPHARLLRALLLPHLELEERVLLPALCALPAEMQETVARAIRRRHALGDR